VAHGFLLVAALVALLAVPCLLAVAIFADIAIDQTEQSARRVWSRWRSRREAAKLERRAGIKPEHRRLLRHQSTPEAAPAGPPFEQVAADLRRLARQRAEVANRSPVWFAAVHRAYDERLRIACRELEIAEHLQELEGIDLEIERLRVEGLLETAGLNLTVVDTDGRQDTR